MSNQDGGVIDPGAPTDEMDMANLTAVRELYDQIDPMPVGLVERTRFAVTLEYMDAEVAKLVETDSLARVRSALGTTEEARTIIFESKTVTVMVSVSPVGDDTVRIDGWLTPEEPYRVEVRTPDAQFQSEADATGRFSVAELPRGVFRMVIRPPKAGNTPANAPVVITPSVVLD